MCGILRAFPRAVAIALAIARQRAHASFKRRRMGPLRKAGAMTIRSRREAVTFNHPFRIRGIEQLLPPGTYQIVTDEEAIEGLSFAAWRRVATMIILPAE